MKHRTRAENVARKGLRLLNERSQKKDRGEAGPPKKRTGRTWGGPKPPTVGERFDKVTAIEEAVPRLDASFNLMWVFACDCGTRFTARVSNIRYNAKNRDWASCTTCWIAAGGYEAAKQRIEKKRGVR